MNDCWAGGYGHCRLAGTLKLAVGGGAGMCSWSTTPLRGLRWLHNTPAVHYLSKRVLLTSIAIGVERFDVRDEHLANFASITELVFLRLILQHARESPEDIARASLHEVHKHGPKIRTLPERIKMSTNTSS